MSVPWKDAKFYAGVDRVRKACGVSEASCEDDAMIGMLLDRFKWDEEKAIEMYSKSLERRSQLGLSAIRDHITSENLKVEDFPHHKEINRLMPIYASASTAYQPPAPPPPPSASSSSEDGAISSTAGPVIGCYEMRYGQLDTESEAITPAQFTTYMIYVTQWRWMQCEAYARKHGELGFWSMVHDLSCPQGILSLWSKGRTLLNKYMAPVEEACGGLFPPMVQKILVINVPRLFSPVWSVVSMLLPQAHKDRIVLLSTSKSTAEELSKYMPQEHLPPHIRDAANADGSNE